MQENHLRWFGHVRHVPNSTNIKFVSSHDQKNKELTKIDVINGYLRRFTRSGTNCRPDDRINLWKIIHVIYAL